MIIVSTLTSTLYVNPTSCAHDLDLWMKPPPHSIMSLRSHLDRYCSNRAMALDPISQSTRSRSPSRRSTTTTTASPFHCPPGWTPPAHRPHRPVIFMFDLKPMQRLAATNSYFNILSPPVAGNLSTPAYDGLFQTFKVIYPDYADSFYISDLQFGSRYIPATLVDPSPNQRLLHVHRYRSRGTTHRFSNSFTTGPPQLVLPHLENTSTPRCLQYSITDFPLYYTSSGPP